jgi:hypothetical protein
LNGRPTSRLFIDCCALSSDRGSRRTAVRDYSLAIKFRASSFFAGGIHQKSSRVC